MKKLIIGILDYGAGNCNSVRNIVFTLGYRSRLISRPEDFVGIDLLLIPGVGAFPLAMKALNELGLITPIRESAHRGLPIIGICLGMQLLADASHELGITQGLELIPGEIKPIVEPKWHIGWNSLEVVQPDTISLLSDGDSFYFNHSYEFILPKEYIVGLSRVTRPVVAIVRKRNIVGFQFHPEKSQIAGMRLIDRAIKELVNA